VSQFCTHLGWSATIGHVLSPDPTRLTKRQETARRLVRCAVELSDERGFEGWTMDDLAERAEVSRRTVFNYFDSKADTVLGPLPDPSDAALEVFLDGGPTGLLIPDLLALADDVFEENGLDPEHLKQTRSVIATDPRLLALVHERFETISARFAEDVLRREGAAYGEDRARLLVRLLVSLCDVAIDRMHADPTRPFTQLFAEAVADARAVLTD
jgi:AcrR family transcriptional regulator